MSLIISFIVISILHQIYSIPKYIFSLRNDHHDRIRQLLHMNCSFPNEYSPLFICSNEIFYHVEFNIDISLAPFQSQLNKCAIIIKYNYISVFAERINQSVFLTSHDINHNNQKSIVFKQQSSLAIDNIDWNKSLMINIYNDIYKNNYCSFQLLPIGPKCSFILQIEPYNISCYLNMKLSKYDHLENKKKHNKYVYMINKSNITQSRNQFNQNFFALLITIFIFTIIPLILFIGNIMYIKQIQTNIPYYLKYYDIRSDTLNE
ncbi:unnamed protein product [Rotaria sordida]|uniref:Uncharacterized protein n=2 Tax=Rotaria sordida TaxID=392033 RepID=A0A819ACI1_9BILA|nr:unnamed protein product [Rotaria sordida]CAF3782832.1 unnamed protein product [Rotaria sordida]